MNVMARIDNLSCKVMAPARAKVARMTRSSKTTKSSGRRCGNERYIASLLDFHITWSAASETIRRHSARNGRDARTTHRASGHSLCHSCLQP
jgi:hypothetical protein